MNDFAELQKIWSTKGIDDRIPDTGKSLSESLLEKLRSFESFQTKLNRFKIVALLAIMVSIVLMLSNLNQIALISYVGISVCFIGVIVFMVYYMKNQFNIAKLDFTNVGLTFLNDAIGMLHRQNNIFKNPVVLMVISQVIGLNMFYFGLNEKSNTTENLITHIVATLFLCACAYLGFRIRLWRIKKEVMPLIEELEKIKKDLQSNNIE